MAWSLNQILAEIIEWEKYLMCPNNLVSIIMFRNGQTTMMIVFKLVYLLHIDPNNVKSRVVIPNLSKVIMSP